VGVPKEIKEGENRVAITPKGVAMLVEKGHQVLVGAGAGLGSGIPDGRFIEAGAELVSAERVYSRSDIVVKVKEPLPEEYDSIRAGQIVFTYFHFASNRDLVRAMMERRSICVAYETVEVDGRHPLLEPMSEVAGKMAVQVAAHYLGTPSGGRGVLLSGVTGVEPAKVVVIGGGRSQS